MSGPLATFCARLGRLLELGHLGKLAPSRHPVPPHVRQPVDLAAARAIARRASSALATAERYHHAKERAFIDDVTGVYNARYLLATADNEIQRAARYGNPLSVLFLDLDTVLVGPIDALARYRGPLALLSSAGFSAEEGNADGRGQPGGEGV